LFFLHRENLGLPKLMRMAERSYSPSSGHTH
jgi:hypothetical protein